MKPTKNLKARLRVTMLDLGIPPHTLGFRYLADGILMVIEDPDLIYRQVTKVIYPTIANQRGTTASCVERAMRHAIMMMWDRNSPEARRAIFGTALGAQQEPPNNSEVMACLAGSLLMPVHVS